MGCAARRALARSAFFSTESAIATHARRRARAGQEAAGLRRVRGDGERTRVCGKHIKFEAKGAAREACVDTHTCAYLSYYY